MRVGRAGIDEVLVAVVEDHCQAQVRHRRERGGTGPHHEPGLPVENREETPVAGLRPQARGERGHLLRRDQPPQGLLELVDVPLVRHHQ